MKQFDYYLFIDYSENYLGYLIVGKEKLKEFLPKIAKFAHYNELKHKKAYLKSIKKFIDKNKIYSHFHKFKIRKIESTPDIYSDIVDFLKKHEQDYLFICVDDKQFINFKRLVKSMEGDNEKIIRESKLKKHLFEYKISLVLDTLLNIVRLKNKKF